LNIFILFLVFRHSIASHRQPVTAFSQNVTSNNYNDAFKAQDANDQGGQVAQKTDHYNKQAFFIIANLMKISSIQFI